MHLHLRRDPLRPRNFKGTIKPVVLVIKNQSSPQLYENIFNTLKNNFQILLVII